MLAVALVVKDFDAEVLNEWTKHLGCDDTLPNLKTLTSFVTPLSLNLPNKSKSASTASHNSSSTKIPWKAAPPTASTPPQC